MDLNTLTLYLAAGGLSLCLSLILMGFARFRQETLAIRSSAAAILILALGFLGAGLGPLLPRWATVIGTNMLLLSAGAIFYSGFSALLQEQKPEFDRFGWAVVLLTALPFWYWGLMEPNGQYRSAVFSFAAAVINGRTAWLLLQAARQTAISMPLRFLALLFGTLTVWMLARSMMLVLAEPVPADQSGANPTSWVTVFWYILLISLVTASILWMEIVLRKENERGDSPGKERRWGIVGIVRGRVSLLWAFVTILAFAVVAELFVTFGALLQTEREKLALNARLANDAFVEHTSQVVNQVDSLLKAMRGYYLRTGSAEEAEHFMAGLGFDRELIQDIYLIDAEGIILTPWKDLALGRNVSEREYFAFHRDNPKDEIFIDQVQTGRVTGKEQFRLTRRISHPDGTFAGAVVAPVEPEAFTNYYRQLVVNRDDLASLLGTHDHKIRARFPAPDPASWSVQVESPVWDALARQPEGSYRSTSVVDMVERQMLYKRVGELPLVMVTGFSDSDVRANALERTWPIALGALIFMLVVVSLASILTLVLRQREEQGKLLLRLKESNDRSTALFNATHEGVILLDGDTPVDCNPGALKIFRAKSKAEFLALRPYDPRLTPPLQPCGTETLVFAKRMIEAAISNGTHRFDYIHRRLDTGEPFPTEIMLTAIHVDGKQILQAVVRDITERIRFETELKEANQALAERNDEQDRFMSMLSHELKTPLAVIRLALGTGSMPAQLKDRVERSVADMNAIVERCLQSDRLSHGRVEFSATTFEVDKRLEYVRAASQAPERIVITANAGMSCHTDVQLLDVILGNLIDNAFKYGAPEGLVAIIAESAEHEGRQGMQIEVVNEPGPAGFPDALAVFRKYYRAPAAHGKTGSGLGLYISAGFARKLGGVLRYQPSADKVKFALWIPG